MQMRGRMAKYSSKKELKALEPFTQIKRWEYNCPAFRSLSGDQFKIYWDMRCRYNGQNNSFIVYSSRQAGECINKSHVTGSRALKRLEVLGFVKVSKHYGYAQKRLAREYELTAISLKPATRKDRLPTGTKDFMRWTDAMIAELKRPALEAAARRKRAKSNRKKIEHSFNHEANSFIGESKNLKVVKLRVK